MNLKLSIDSIPITNSSTSAILIALEPEGDTIEMPAGATCKIVPVPELGAANDLEFELDIKDDMVSIYLVCEKSVFINGVQLR